MTAIDVIRGLKGRNEPTQSVDETSLPRLLRQEGTGCDCKGCDKD